MVPKIKERGIKSTKNRYKPESNWNISSIDRTQSSLEHLRGKIELHICIVNRGPEMFFEKMR